MDHEVPAHFPLSSPPLPYVAFSGFFCHELVSRSWEAFEDTLSCWPWHHTRGPQGQGQLHCGRPEAARK